MKSSVCALYKLLYNPVRLEMFRRIYDSRDGVNVGVMVGELTQMGVKQSCVSQYLKQLEGAHVIMRRRAGKFVNYQASTQRATPGVEGAVKLIVSRLRETPPFDFETTFGVLMNPFRAEVVGMLRREGPKDAAAICERLGHQMKYLKRDLKTAVDAGLIASDGCAMPTYRYVAPDEPTRDGLIALCD